MISWGPAAFPLVTALAAAILLFNVRSILLPFTLATVMAFLLNPLVRFVEVRGVRRGPVVLLVFISLMTLLSFGLYKGAVIAAFEADEAAQHMPLYIGKGRKFIADWEESAVRAQNSQGRKTVVEKSAVLRTLLLDPRFIHSVARNGEAWPERILHKMPSFASGILPALELAVLVPFIAFFLMWEGPRMRDTALAWMPSRYVEMALNILVELDNSLGRYLRGVSLEALCVGCIAFAGFSLIGLDYALQVAIVAGIANLVPYMGPVISGVLATGIALFQNNDPALVMRVAGVCLILRLADDFFIQPTVLRQAIHLHPILIVFAIMSGAHLYGFWGLLFAVPAACMIKVILEVLWPWYRSQYGLAGASPLPEVNRIPLI